MSELAELLPAQLLENCRNRTKDDGHERYCFEIFYRAVCDSSQGCWSILYEQYLRMVYQWVLKYAKNSRMIGETAVDEMVQEAFTAFWQAYRCEHLKLAPNGLASILNFLESCAWSSVQHALRRLRTQRHQNEVELSEQGIESLPVAKSSEIPERALIETTMTQQFWSTVDSCCIDERERAIVHLRFVNDWKPSEIIQRRPDLAADVKEIYLILRNIKDRVARNPGFQGLQGDMVV